MALIELTSMIPIILAFIVSSAIYCLRSTLDWRARSRGRPLPPGPPALPFIGNVLNLPRVKQWIGFLELSAYYGKPDYRLPRLCISRRTDARYWATGDIIHINILGQTMLILNSADSVFELLDKRAANTSDRHENPMVEL